MSTTSASKVPQTTWAVPDVLPLNQAMWRAWEAKGHYQDREASRAQSKAVYWLAIAALLAATGLWSYLPPYEVVVRFIVCIGALAGAFQSYSLRRYAMLGVFALLTILFNPVLPLFNFTGEWQRVVALLSVLPFGLSLAKLSTRRSKYV